MPEIYINNQTEGFDNIEEFAKILQNHKPNKFKLKFKNNDNIFQSSQINNGISHLVLAVVKHYVKKYKDDNNHLINFNELEEKFPKIIEGRTTQIIYTLKEAQEKIKKSNNTNRAKLNYFLEDNNHIKLSDDTVVVYTQWALRDSQISEKANFVRFLYHCIKELGYEIEINSNIENNQAQVIQNEDNLTQTESEEENLTLQKELKILKYKKQIILQGAPGTGKTYQSAQIAMNLIESSKDYKNNRKDLMKDYQAKVASGQIVFTTFHQALDYEEFLEGYKPISNDDNNLSYEVQDGVFKKLCKEAGKNENKNYVLIIDEINRGNIAKIFGELITLLEADKRQGKTNEIKVKLPYSKKENNENEEFTVPDNLYIIGTMNTADKSIGHIDYAIRRRFAFITLKADEDKIEDQSAQQLFREVKTIIDENISSDLNADDLMIGHSYFMAQGEQLKLKLNYEIKPLLREYINDGVLIGDELTKKIDTLTV